MVTPCEPNRVPYLPVQILYQIAKALPQPKQVFHLALASKEIWEYLQPALYECEVTYEARLAHEYGGQSSTSLQKYYAFYLRGDGDNNSVGERENEEDTAPAAELSCQHNKTLSLGKFNPGECDECGIGRIIPDKRIFEAQMPRIDEQYRIDGAMTALHWASMHGASALPVAQKAIRAALVHQPSYINGLNLINRHYRKHELDDESRLVIADHPPPLFLAVAQGNLEVCQALIYAGADTSLLLGLTTHVWDPRGKGEVKFVSSKIHRQCVEDWLGQVECVCELPIEPDEYADLELISCQTVGYVAVGSERTEILQMLLRSGLNVQQGSWSLVHCAVLGGNLAAVKALLQHDPSLVHSRHKGNTPMHSVPFMKKTIGTDIPEEQVEAIVSCLLEHGAILDAPADGYDAYFEHSPPGETPLQFALTRLCHLDFESDEDSILTTLRAVNVFISMGSSWVPPLPDSDLLLRYAIIFPGFSQAKDGILANCLEKTILLVTHPYLGDYDLWDSHFDPIRYRAVRKAWGQICKTIVAKASESLSRDTDADTRATVEAALSLAFRRLVHQANHYWHRAGIVGWWALEAVGNLLLSTGIMPGDETMRGWERILKRDYEAPGLNVKLIKDCEALDGDESEWAFLLAGVNAKETEAD